MVSIEEIILYTLIGVNLILIIWLVRLEIKSKDIILMKNKESLREKLQSIDNKLNLLYRSDQEITKQVEQIENKFKNSLQNVEVYRFNPFKNDGVGGNQSFATSLLNKKGDGVIISSLYSRENVRVFAKPIKGWQSNYELSEEEKIVLNKTKVLK